MADPQLLLFAKELRTRAKEILARAASTDDPEAQGMMRVVAAGYEKTGAADGATHSRGSPGVTSGGGIRRRLRRRERACLRQQRGRCPSGRVGSNECLRLRAHADGNVM